MQHGRSSQLLFFTRNFRSTTKLYTLYHHLCMTCVCVLLILHNGGLTAFHSLPEMLQTLLMAILGTAFSTQVPDKKDQHEFETMTGCWRCCNDRGFPCLPTCYLCSPMNWTWQAKYSANPARRYHTQEITKGCCHHLIVVRRGCCLELFAFMALHANHHFVYAIAVALIPLSHILYPHSHNFGLRPNHGCQRPPSPSSSSPMGW